MSRARSVWRLDVTSFERRFNVFGGVVARRFFDRATRRVQAPRNGAVRAPARVVPRQAKVGARATPRRVARRRFSFPRRAAQPRG
eukprot:2703119-Lingulodinium_polyedra.AAC.1